MQTQAMVFMTAAYTRACTPPLHRAAAFYCAKRNV
jgi:hypothetical protein